MALGGDGFMLETLHRNLASRPADLRHEPRLGRLPDERLRRGRACSSASPAAERAVIHPLVMRAERRGRRRTARRWPSTRSRCCARPTRPPSCASSSTARRGWRSWSATACWWRRRPARPPTTSPPTARSSRSAAQVLALTPISAFRPAALARRAFVAHRQGDHRDPRAGQAAGQRRGRQRRGPRRGSGRCGRGPVDQPVPCCSTPGAASRSGCWPSSSRPEPP